MALRERSRQAALQSFLKFQNFALPTKIPSLNSVSSPALRRPVWGGALCCVGDGGKCSVTRARGSPEAGGRLLPRAQPVSRRPGDEARTWTGASGCSSGGAPPHSGATSASPPGPPSPQTCGRPRRAPAPPPPPPLRRRGTETPHPPNPAR